TLLSASSDGLVNIFNTSISDKDEALMQIINHQSSVHHANFLSETEISALSNDEQLSIYRRTEGVEAGGREGGDEGRNEDEDEDEDEVPASVFGDIRPALGCEYVIDVLPAAGGGGGGLVCAGSHKYVRKLACALARLRPFPPPPRSVPDLAAAV
ncbi:MAG: hypothetical protein LQ340_007636, partial [Diploschistes diacapsis]